MTNIKALEAERDQLRKRLQEVNIAIYKAWEAQYLAMTEDERNAYLAGVREQLEQSMQNIVWREVDEAQQHNDTDV